MKKHNILKVVLITICLLVLCTWIFPTSNFSYTELVTGERAQLGLFDLFSYPLVSFSYFGYAFVYVLVCGALYGVLYKIPAYKEMLERIVKGLKGKESIFLIATMVLLSVLTSVSGLSFGFVIVFPIIISLIMMMGYNKLVAASVTIGSVITGLIGTTVGSSSVYYLNSVLEVSIFDEIVSKILILVITLGLLIFNVLDYAKKTKNNVNKEDDSLIPEKVENRKTSKSKGVKVWPLALVFDLMVLVILLGSFAWVDVFKLNIFDTFVDYMQKDLSINGFPILYKVLGNVTAFGKWTFNMELQFVPLLAAAIIAIIYRVKFDEFLDGILDGMKRAVKPASYLILVFIILIICTYHPFQLTIIKPILGLTKGINVVTMSLVAFLASLFNVDTIYVAQATVPYVTSVITDSSLYPLIEIIYQSMYGLAMLVLPSSILLVSTLSYMDISYTQWLKHIWKFFVETLIVLIVIFIILLVV